MGYSGSGGVERPRSDSLLGWVVRLLVVVKSARSRGLRRRG